jgi:hypothetical protein
MSCLIQSVERLTGQDRQSVLIVDDSLFSRNRSKKVELFARIFDHTSHKFYKGFRMLTLGWSDGNTFLPVSFNLLSSTNDNNVYCPAQPKDRRTLAHKRRERSRQSTTDALLTCFGRPRTCRRDSSSLTVGSRCQDRHPDQARAS